MARLIWRIRYLVVIILLLLAGRYALRQQYRTALKRFGEVHELPADPPAGGSFARPKPTRRQPMAEAFRNGRLPDPLPIPAGDPDQIAADLTEKIAAKDEESTAALLTAFQMAGFSTYAPDGQLAVKPASATQGMAFEAFSVAAMAKLYNDGWHMSLADLSVVLTKAMPAFQKVSLIEILENGIATASRGEQPLRFWGRLIIALGKQSSSGYDLSSGKVDPAVQLDSIQTSLILQRLYGDLESRRKPDPPRSFHSELYHHRGSQESWFRPAVFHPERRAGVVLTGQEPEPGQPCESEILKTLLDAQAIFRTTEWNALIHIEEMETPGPASYANAVLTILKVVWVYAALHVDVTMDAPVLVRSYDTDNSETRTLTARVWFEIGNWSLLNCLRPAMGKLDFGNLPNDGAAKGIGVAWLPGEGFGPGYATIEFHNDPQGLVAATHKALVFFDNRGGAEGDPTDPFRKADEYGKANMKVTGIKQPTDLTYQKKAPVMKEMSVGVSVKYKEVSEVGDMLGEFLDVLGPGLGIASGDLPAGLATALAETIFRMHWQIGGSFSFPVRDWLPCRGGWVGTMRYTAVLKSTQTTPQPAGGFVRVTIDNSQQSRFQVVSPRSDDDANLVGTVSAELTNKNLRLFHSLNTDNTQETTTVGSETGKASFTIDETTSGEFFIQGGADQDMEVTAKTVEHFYGQTREDPPFTYRWRPEGVHVSGAFDLKHPDELSGSESKKLPDGTVVTMEWSLVRCSKQPSPKQ